MPPFFRPKPEPPRQSLLYEVRDKVLHALVLGALAVIGLLGSILYNVDFLVRELPKILEDLDHRQTASERSIKSLEEGAGRMLTVMERLDERLRALENKK
jgi:hypothetical protein